MSYVHVELNFLPEKFNQGTGSMPYKGLQVVQRFVLKAPIADKF